MANKQYLGDGVYIEFDGFGFVLTTENGISATNVIYLEPDVINSFDRYIKRIKEQIKQNE